MPVDLGGLGRRQLGQLDSSAPVQRDRRGRLGFAPPGRSTRDLLVRGCKLAILTIPTELKHSRLGVWKLPMGVDRMDELL